MLYKRRGCRARMPMLRGSVRLRPMNVFWDSGKMPTPAFPSIKKRRRSTRISARCILQFIQYERGYDVDAQQLGDRMISAVQR